MAKRESVGSRVGRLRRQKKLTMAELAKQVGVSGPTVWAWERGKSSPRGERIPALAEILQVTESELIVGEAAVDSVPRSKALEDEIARCKARIAALTGTSVDKVFIDIRL